MRCPNCKTDTLRPWSGTITRMDVEIPTSGDRCSTCDETLFAFAEVERQSRVLAEAIVDRGIQSAADFKFVRKAIGLKAAELAALLDVTAETVSRWERGHIVIPLAVAFTVGELYEHPRAARARLERLAADRAAAPT